MKRIEKGQEFRIEEDFVLELEMAVEELAGVLVRGFSFDDNRNSENCGVILGNVRWSISQS